MQAVGANHEIKMPWMTAFEPNLYTMLILLEAHDLLVEYDFCDRLRFLQQQASQVATPNRDETPSSYLAEDVCTKPRLTLTFVVNDPHLPHAVIETIELSTQSHSVGDVISESPKVNDVAARPNRRRALDDRRFPPCPRQPIRKRWAGYAGSRDEGSPICHK